MDDQQDGDPRISVQETELKMHRVITCNLHDKLFTVIAGLVPAIHDNFTRSAKFVREAHVLSSALELQWITATSAVMTTLGNI